MARWRVDVELDYRVGFISLSLSCYPDLDGVELLG